MNLHRVWDSVILKRLMNPTGGKQLSAKDYAQSLVASMNEKQAKQWAGGDPERWANESHSAAVKVVYDGIPTDGPPPKITDQYLQAAEPMVNEQLSKAGVRLAYI